MITFLCGLAILLAGGWAYGKFAEKLMKPTDAPTPAVTMRDDIDYVPMPKWRNSLIELLNIAGTGPVLGPIQGILFGPIAFLTIPIGNVIAGAFHDYMIGMISVRNKGAQNPKLVQFFLGKWAYAVYTVFVSLLLLLVGVVFVYTPADIFLGSVLKQEDTTLANPMLWVVLGVIFVYYLLASLLPIDKIIGRIYPVFGLILLLSAVGIFFGLFIFHDRYPLVELWQAAEYGYPFKPDFLPVFFVTVTCGLMSGFHSTQATLISRTVSDEREGLTTFYGMMIAEGFIAMSWAGAAMGALQAGLNGLSPEEFKPLQIVGWVATDMLGTAGGIVALLGIIVLPITSGDTALRALRLSLAESFGLDQKVKKNVLVLAIPIFAVVFGVLIWAKADADGFGLLWRYFSWANETIAVFAFAIITVYMIRKGLPWIMGLVPGMFYMFIVTTYLMFDQTLGFRQSLVVSAAVGVVFAAVYAVLVIRHGRDKDAPPPEATVPAERAEEVSESENLHSDIML